jgi:hypothetical protein
MVFAQTLVPGHVLLGLRRGIGEGIAAYHRRDQNQVPPGDAVQGKPPPDALWLTSLGGGWLSCGSADSERRHWEQMLDDLPPNALVVADAGFVGYELVNAY